jgi:hypothetical protein
MALYIPHSIFHLARILYARPETFGPYYVRTLPVFLCFIRSCSKMCAYGLDDKFSISTERLSVFIGIMSMSAL